MFDKCYDFLKENFGQMHLAGAEYLSYCVEIYNKDTPLYKIYNMCAEKYSSTPLAIARAIAYYVDNVIVKDNDLDVLSEFFGHQFRRNAKHIKNKEIIHILSTCV